MRPEQSQPDDSIQEPLDLTDDEAAESIPSVSSVYDYLLYGLSLPERALRSSSAIVGGAVKETACLVIPLAFRSSRSYEAFVGQMLDFMVNDVAGVKSAEPSSEDCDVENYVARKTVSSFVDLAGVATLHVSPLAVLAILSDLAYGSKTYLHELSGELKREGVISQDTTIDSTAQLLDAIGNASANAVDAFDTPPLSIDGLRETIRQTSAAINDIDPSQLMPLAEIERTWNEMTEMAIEQHVSLFELSSAMTMFTLNRLSAVTQGALSTVRVTGNLFDRHMLDHYRSSLVEINRHGIYAILAETSKPYVDALWYNFSTQRETVTADLLRGKLIGKAWSGFRDWFGSNKSPQDDVPDSHD